MYLLIAILVIATIWFAFWFGFYGAFRTFQHACPQLYQRFEHWFRPHAEKHLGPLSRAELKLCPPTNEELRLHQHWVNFGLKLEEPNYFLPWEAGRDELARNLATHGGKFTEPDTFVLATTLVGNCRAEIAVHFDDLLVDNITHASIRLSSSSGATEAFAANEDYLQTVFGIPSPSEHTSRSEWDFPLVSIRHELIAVPYSDALYEGLTIGRKGRWALSARSKLTLDEHQSS